MQTAPCASAGGEKPDVATLQRRGEIDLRIAAWACVALLAFLSLLPADEMIRTGLSGHIEHAATYAGTALLSGLGYRKRGRGRIAAMLMAYAGTLEVLQLWTLDDPRSPGADGAAAAVPTAKRTVTPGVGPAVRSTKPLT